MPRGECVYCDGTGTIYTVKNGNAVSLPCVLCERERCETCRFYFARKIDGRGGRYSTGDCKFEKLDKYQHRTNETNWCENYVGR